LKPASAKPNPSSCPGIVISALRGGAGKTIFSVGIIAALRNRGSKVAPFKKGPDYIDAGWLGLAAGRPCYNLDTFLIDSPAIIDSYLTHSRDTDIAVVEGNRGLYDCIHTDGLTCTAELAKLLGLPVILSLDVTKTTRTLAAVVSGCLAFDPDVMIKGVILNRVAGARHEKIVRDSIEHYCGIPVLGVVPKLKRQSFPERHMGLVPTYEHQWAQDAVGAIAEIARQYLDISAIANLASHPAASKPSSPSPVVDLSGEAQEAKTHEPAQPKPTIGIVRDSAFQFYYPENLEALVQAGAKLVVTSPLFEDDLPDVDALYIGGGFPETHAPRLARNASYRRQIKSLAQIGLPIYAECGGLMYLGRELVLDDGTYPMADVLPVRFGFTARPQGHGYATARVTQPNPFFEPHQTLKGHEFHYSKVLECRADERELVFEMTRGNGIINSRDGLCINNVFATYLHIHALGTPQWAPALVKCARAFLAKKSTGS